MKRFPEKVLARLEGLGKNQVAMARAVDVDPSQLSRWLREGSRNKPRTEQLLSISKFLQVSMNYLVDDSCEGLDRAEDKSETGKAIELMIKTIGEEEAWKRLTVASSPLDRPVMG